MSICN